MTISLQLQNEELFKSTNSLFTKDLTSMEEYPDMLEKAIQAYTKYRLSEYYPSKELRLAELKETPETYYKIVGSSILMLGVDTFIANVMGRIACKLPGTPKQALNTAGELLAIFQCTGLYTVTQRAKGSRYVVSPNYTIEDDLQVIIKLNQYPPPLVCEPNSLKSNNSSPYLSIPGGNLILGEDVNTHDQNISLDVLNIMNSTPYVFKPNEEEVPQTLTTEDEHSHYCQGRDMTIHCLDGLDTIYFAHKVDKRGRVYTQGYFINPQGTEYQKSELEFKPEVLV